MAQKWINKVRNLEFIPHPDQEPRDGFLYSVSFFENNEKKLEFTPSHMDGHYYLHNEELKQYIEQLFESRFE